jgi:hypothetical protein
MSLKLILLPVNIRTADNTCGFKYITNERFCTKLALSYKVQEIISLQEETVTQNRFVLGGSVHIAVYMWV